MTLEKLSIGSKVVDTQYLSRGVGEIALRDADTVSVIYEMAIVVYPTNSLGMLIGVSLAIRC